MHYLAKKGFDSIDTGLNLLFCKIMEKFLYRLSCFFNLTHGYTMKPSVKLFVVTIICHFVIAGCGTTLKQVSVSDAEVQIEREKQQDAVFSLFTERSDKLHNISYPLLMVAGDIFPKQTRPIYGFLLHDKYLYGKLLGHEYEEVAERHNIGEKITVGYIHPDFPVGATGLKIGDQIISINDKLIEKMNAYEAMKILQHLKEDAPIKLSIKRDFQINKLVIPCVLGCKYPINIANNDVINAWADNKSVTVTTGLIRFCESDRELALVLGHEISHNALKHVVKTRTNAIIGSIFDVAIQLATGVSTSNTFGSIGASVFSIAFEEEADYAGLYILSRAKYDISGAGNFFRRMAAEHPSSIKSGFLASHPTSPKRFVSIEHTIEEIEEKKQNGIPLFPEEKAKDVKDAEDVQETNDEEEIFSGIYFDTTLFS
jgi:hypothetical protein